MKILLKFNLKNKYVYIVDVMSSDLQAQKDLEQQLFRTDKTTHFIFALNDSGSFGYAAGKYDYQEKGSDSLFVLGNPDCPIFDFIKQITSKTENTILQEHKEELTISLSRIINNSGNLGQLKSTIQRELPRVKNYLKGKNPVTTWDKGKERVLGETSGFTPNEMGNSYRNLAKKLSKKEYLETPIKEHILDHNSKDISKHIIPFLEICSKNNAFQTIIEAISESKKSKENKIFCKSPNQMLSAAYVAINNKEYVLCSISSYFTQKMLENKGDLVEQWQKWVNHLGTLFFLTAHQYNEENLEKSIPPIIVIPTRSPNFFFLINTLYKNLLSDMGTKERACAEHGIIATITKTLLESSSKEGSKEIKAATASILKTSEGKIHFSNVNYCITCTLLEPIYRHLLNASKILNSENVEQTEENHDLSPSHTAMESMMKFEHDPKEALSINQASRYIIDMLSACAEDCESITALLIMLNTKSKELDTTMVSLVDAYLENMQNQLAKADSILKEARQIQSDNLSNTKMDPSELRKDVEQIKEKRLIYQGNLTNIIKLLPPHKKYENWLSSKKEKFVPIFLDSLRLPKTTLIEEEKPLLKDNTTDKDTVLKFRVIK